MRQVAELLSVQFLEVGVRRDLNLDRRAGVLVVVVPLLVLMFDLRNNFPVQIILVDLSMDSVHLDRNRGKTTNWMRRVNGTKFPTSILVDPIIRRPASLQTWAQKLDISFVNLRRLSIHSYISRVMKTGGLQRST
jgi:hypothetical protein